MYIYMVVHFVCGDFRQNHMNTFSISNQLT